MHIRLNVMNRHSCPILMKLELSRHTFEKYSNTKFHENPSIGSLAIPCERTQTHTTKLKVAFRNFANTPKYGYSGEKKVLLLR